MPRGDRTGPMGQGPMTGRNLGFCAGYDTPGMAKFWPWYGIRPRNEPRNRPRNGIWNA